MDQTMGEVPISEIKGSLDSIKINEAKDELIRNWRGEPRLPNRQQEAYADDDHVVPQIRERWFIFRVPSHVREIDEKAYTPKSVSIGPFHRNNPALKPMEAHKSRILRRLIKKIGKYGKSLHDLENAIRNEENRTRQCYSEEFTDMDSDDFVQMMVLDACFIVEILRLNEKFSKKREDPEEPMFGTRWMLPIIARDLLMLENQLPMFVLQKIYDELTSSSRDIDNNPTPLNKLALQFFESLRPCKDKMPSNERLDGGEGSYPHLLALFQASFAPNPNTHSSPSKKWNDCNSLPGKGWVNNAIRLTFAGIKLRGRFGDHGHLLDIEFEKGTLKIPTLFLDDGTSPLLRNLIAYEQANRYTKPYFTCLAVLLDSMVDTSNDIDVLRSSGIIKQAKGGNDEIVELLNSLTKELEFNMDDCGIIKKTVEDVNNFCRTWKARLRIPLRLYLSRINFLALVLSYLSIMQTYFVAH